MKRPSFRKQAGVALVTAIFLLVVLAGLVVAVVSLSSSQQSNAAKDEMGSRAYLAARAGIEWALYTALTPTNTDHYAQLGCASMPVSFTLPASSTLAGFTVTVSCSAKAAGFGDNTSDDPTAGHFKITAVACNVSSGSCPVANPGPDYVQRTVTAQL